ncbi:MAG: hypothetical protein ABIN58_02370 [candidate division WOR-3 bacterium]
MTRGLGAYVGWEETWLVEAYCSPDGRVQTKIIPILQQITDTTLSFADWLPSSLRVDAQGVPAFGQLLLRPAGVGETDFALPSLLHLEPHECPRGSSRSAGELLGRFLTFLKSNLDEQLEAVAEYSVVVAVPADLLPRWKIYQATLDSVLPPNWYLVSEVEITTKVAAEANTVESEYLLSSAVLRVQIEETETRIGMKVGTSERWQAFSFGLGAYRKAVANQLQEAGLPAGEAERMAAHALQIYADLLAEGKVSPDELSAVTVGEETGITAYNLHQAFRSAGREFRRSLERVLMSFTEVRWQQVAVTGGVYAEALCLGDIAFLTGWQPPDLTSGETRLESITPYRLALGAALLAMDNLKGEVK